MNQHDQRFLLVTISLGLFIVGLLVIEHLPVGYLPLFGGYAVTGALVFFKDFRNRKVPDLLWLPAALGIVVFYVTNPPVLFSHVVLFVILTAAGSLTIYATSKQMFGQADVIGVTLLSFFPYLLLPVMLPAFAVALGGKYVHKWDAYGIPLAGLIGLFIFPAMAVFLL